MVAGHIIEYYISFLVCNACFMYTGMEDTQQKRERIFFITHILYIYFVYMYYNMMRYINNFLSAPMGNVGNKISYLTFNKGFL